MSAILNPEFDGVPGPAVPVITTLADYFGVAGPTTPEVTIDGTNNNVLACTTTGTCGDGFFFDSAGIYTSYVLGTTPAPYFAVGPSYSGGSTALYEPYSAANWSIVVVPEPATWTMMLVAMGSLGLAMRLRRNRPGLAAA